MRIHEGFKTVQDCGSYYAVWLSDMNIDIWYDLQVLHS